MKTLDFEKFDAFASGKSTGNPAAGIRLEKISDLNEAEMISIAKQLEGFVNEVGFIDNKGNWSKPIRFDQSNIGLLNIHSSEKPHVPNPGLF